MQTSDLWARSKDQCNGFRGRFCHMFGVEQNPHSTKSVQGQGFRTKEHRPGRSEVKLLPTTAMGTGPFCSIKMPVARSSRWLKECLSRSEISKQKKIAISNVMSPSWTSKGPYPVFSEIKSELNMERHTWNASPQKVKLTMSKSEPQKLRKLNIRKGWFILRNPNRMLQRAGRHTKTHTHIFVCVCTPF